MTFIEFSKWWIIGVIGSAMIGFNIALPMIYSPVMISVSAFTVLTSFIFIARAAFKS